jgi:GH15 family glucan-1,4-alpha-glucosidase
VAGLIEDYALIGDTETVALVRLDGSIDWFCAPRFDSAACFAALVGDEGNGRWKLSPSLPVLSVTRRYRPGTLVLETEITTETGTVAICDFMPIRDTDPTIIRIVEGRRGHVAMDMELRIRFDYGSVVPWVRRSDHSLRAVAGADALVLHTPVATRGRDLSTVASFEVGEGDRVPFQLTWHPSHLEAPLPFDAAEACERTEAWWLEWFGSCTYDGPWADLVRRSLITLKALTYAPTGGVVAAPTTSIPEQIGGVRNWDYRYCWLRDASFTLQALVTNGYPFEAAAWREWLHRAVAGDPASLQILYGVAGERRLVEMELPWLAGYEGSAPVRIGNAASGQLQLDVYGEVLDLLHAAVTHGIDRVTIAWPLVTSLLDHLATVWDQPDDGIWETRGGRQHFTYSKLMAWVAFDRAVRIAGERSLPGPVDEWSDLRDELHREICERAYDPARGAFMQAYDSDELDASVLQMALVGFLPPTDPRIVGTVEAIQQHLLEDGFVLRYRTHPAAVVDGDAAALDGLPPGEGVFLMCSFWLADNLVLLGRVEEATELFERLIGLANDVGLLAEEYDVALSRQVGNFPQAFSHIALINSAMRLCDAGAEAGVLRAGRAGRMAT